MDGRRRRRFARLLDEREADALQRQRQAEEAVAAITDARDGAQGDDEHDPEGVTLSAEWSRWDGLHRDAEAEVLRIHAARRRLADATYGVCEGCGAEIPEGRLEILPFAALCVACAERVERR